MSEWIYGRNPVFEVLRAGRRKLFQLHLASGVQEKEIVLKILHLCEQRRVKVLRVARAKMDSLAPNHQGVMLEVGDYCYASLEDMAELSQVRKESLFLLILDAMQDPQNFGVLLRTAEAVGIHGVLLPLRHAVQITPAVVNASSGACEHLLIGKMNLAQALRKIKSLGTWVYGLESDPQAVRLDKTDLSGSIALVVGSEGQGMRRLVREHCDQLVCLPMRGKVESLNAAVAGSIALYFAWSQKNFEDKVDGIKKY
ncbi:MAG: 23S rRNA (guanosine(2251)-2'-O)-methyltransferase RlmB [Chloroflexota bacterium]